VSALFLLRLSNFPPSILCKVALGQNFLFACKVLLAFLRFAEPFHFHVILFSPLLHLISKYFLLVFTRFQPQKSYFLIGLAAILQRKREKSINPWRLDWHAFRLLQKIEPGDQFA